ncbi:MAG: TonB-dependent receptor [Chitinophagaceae bacterium]|nr:TonB-dependent receptor [Chitinophagaceae bacterium]
MKLKRLLIAMLPLLFCCFSALAQTRTVTGKVTDSKDGSGVPGVAVTVKGTKIGTQTAADGSFTLKVPDAGKILVLSSVGYTPLEISADGPLGSLQMVQASSVLNDIVVVGYGVQTRREVTGAISKVSGDQISSIPVPSFEAALQGKAPGVQVVSGNGLAGSSSVIRIRGVGSISASGDPLYVIDGIPIISDPFIRGNSSAMNQNPLSSINPNDIASIEILKDAGATGIYGSRGANGVILVTTKRGKSGKPAFTYSNKLGAATYSRKPSFVDGPTWLQLRQEAWTNDGNTGYAPLPGNLTWAQASQTNTDWWDELTQVGFINDHSLSMTQGNKRLKTFANLTYSNDEGYIRKNAYIRMAARLNMDYAISSKLKVGLTSAYNRGTNKRVKAAWDGGIGDAMPSALPIFPVYKSDGSYATGLTNPIISSNEEPRRETNSRILGGLSLEYQPIKNLFLKASGSIEYTTANDDQFSSLAIRRLSSSMVTTGFANRSHLWGSNQTANVTASYLWNPSAVHKFNFLLGSEVQDYERKGYSTDPIGQELDTPYWEDNAAYNNRRDSLLSAPAPTRELQKEAFTFNSFFGRINYTFNNKYSIQLIARVDGSSKFGTNNKRGFFPAASAAWIVSDENFMQAFNKISYLKLRASYGVVGNANIPSGAYYDNYRSGGNPYNANSTLYLNDLGNPDLKWETLKNIDVAVEFGLFNNRLTGEVAYYNKASTDILLRPGISPSTGFERAWRNLSNSEILNEGIEISGSYKIVDGKDFRWTVGGNIAKNRNEVLKYELGPDAVQGGTNDTRIVVGLPVGVNYLVRYSGVDPVDGLPIWLDNSGKQTKTYSLNHRVYAGSVMPDWIGGFNTNLQYKGFELSTLFTFVIGGNLYESSGKYQFLGLSRKNWNFREDFLDRWTEPGDVSKYPRLVYDAASYPGVSSEDQFNSTMFLESASYLRMRELTLAYVIPNSILRKLPVKNIRLFVTGTNLLTFTKYSGGDPEITRDFEDSQDRNLSPNITYLTAPSQKTIIGGLTVNF